MESEPAPITIEGEALKETPQELAKKDENKEDEDDADKIFAYSIEFNDKLIVLLPTEKAADADFNTILCSVANAVMHPKQKNSFWKRFIPWSGDKPFDVVRKVILLLATCTFIVSSFMLVNILVLEPAANDSTNNGIRSLLVSAEENSDGSTVTRKPVDGSQGILLDFSKLYSENPDTIGWITVPNTLIDYVVVKPQDDQDPEYYLYRDFYGNSTKYGTVFMDYRSKVDSKNLILHGHHMQDGRMFANLKNFEDLTFYKSTPTFTFNTIFEKSQWKIISIFKTNTLDYQGDFFNYLRGSFQNDYDFLNFVYQIRERSIIDCPVSVNENDTLVTLSTCTYDFEEFRFVVVARKVRDGEDATVDVSAAAENPDTLYPDIWYYYYDGTKPEVTTFQDAYNKNKITWYDGKRTDWSEADDKELTKTLDNGKKNAVDLLNKFFAKYKFDPADKESATALLQQYIDKINAASSGQEVNEIYENAINDFKKYKTAEEKEESNKQASTLELTNKRASAKVDVHNSIAGNSYRNAEMEKVNQIFEEYNEKIDNAATVEEIEKLKKEGIAKLAAIKTDDELTKEESDRRAAENSKQESSKPESSRQESSKPESSKQESSLTPEEQSRLAEESRRLEEESKALKLKEAKEQAINAINLYVDEKDYYPEQQAEINSIKIEYIGYINNAMMVSTVNFNVTRARAQLSKIKTKAQIDAESSEDSSEPEPISEPESSDEPQPESSVEESEESTENPEVPD